MKDLTTNVPNKVKPTSLSEMFSSELKFTTDILVWFNCVWFNDIFKSQFNELDMIKKHKLLKEKLTDWHNEKCVICDLKLAVSFQECCEKTTKKWPGMVLLFKKNI